jgi:hypothetical protein
VVAEKKPQIPQIASEYQDALKRAGVTKEQLLGNLYEVKQKVAEEEGRA